MSVTGEVSPQAESDVGSQRNEEDGAEERMDEVVEQPTKKQRKPRVKLDIAFFKGEVGEEPKDKLWDMFLDVIEPFPSFQEQQLQATLDESNQISFHRSLIHSLGGGQQRISEAELEKSNRRLRAVHLDSLLKKMRNWEQNEYPYGLSMKDFGTKMLKVTHKTDFLDYRADLIHKYKTSDWRRLGAERRRLNARADEGTDETVAEQFNDDNMDQQDPEELISQPPSKMYEEPPAPHPQISADALAEIRQRREAALKRRREMERAKQAATVGVSASPTDSPSFGTPNSGLSDAQRQAIEENKRKALEKRMLVGVVLLLFRLFHRARLKLHDTPKNQS
eukprot:GHVN01106260.1.p1 GENE.GHVN01106260.1~~GHVN01106260.1.p1  ORF type:complete len:336 (+),score=76.57 GHVN01106260.1:41-1048(+)